MREFEILGLRYFFKVFAPEEEGSIGARLQKLRWALQLTLARGEPHTLYGWKLTASRLTTCLGPVTLPHLGVVTVPSTRACASAQIRVRG